MPEIENELEEAAQHITGRRKTIKGATETASSLLQSEQNELGKSETQPAVAVSQDERKKGKMWDTEEIMGYYEAVKQHGKDWDRLVTAMQKKKIHKDKDQIRNFFFNCVKFLRNLCDINVDEMFPEVCRDAKELFFVINSCEWRKRTGASKYQPERLKELILEGVTTIKANKKNMVIRTPFCPSLQKYFTEYRIAQNDKPSELQITLQPATYIDKNYVLSCEQNPSLCLRISTNDRIARIFELLGHKWVSKQGYADLATITLLPDKTTEIGRVTLVGADPYGDIISLSKLKREQDSIKQKKGNENGQAAVKPIVPTYNVVINRPFTIDGQLVINGLTAANVGEASVAELYCLCGLSTNIKLLYKIEAVQQPGTETWKIFRELMTREYGDQLASSGREEEKTKDTVAPKIPESKEQMVRRKRPAPQSVTEAPPPPIAHEQEALLRYKEQLKSCASRTVKIRGKKKEQQQSPKKPRTLVYSSNVYSTAEFLDNGRCQAPEPTDFSQMVTSSSSSGTVTPSSEPVQQAALSDKQRSSFKDLFADDLDYSPRKMATNSLCSDSMQNIVHSTMKDVLHQDSNQAINVFSELLDDFEEDPSHQ